MRWVAIGLAMASLAWVSGARAQAHPQAQVYRQIVEGCMGEAGAEAAYTCACTAVAMVERCEASGARTAGAMLACVQQNEAAWAHPIVATCRAYGALRLGARVPAPAARPSPPVRDPSTPTMTDVQIWNAFYGGCVREDGGVAYACGCFATATVAACAPSGSAAATFVESCVQSVAPTIERLAPSCSAAGSLHYQPAAAAPAQAAAPAAPTPLGANPDARRICGGANFAEPDMRAACERVLATVVGDDVDSFLSAIPRGARIRLFGQARAPAAAVRARIQREGGLVRLLGGQSASADVVGDADSPLLLVYSNDIVDRPAPEASFRWDAMNGSWELISIQEPPSE